MPKLVKLYITSVAIGFGLAVLFVGALVAMDVAGLQHLVLGSSTGWLAALMMVVFNGIVFAGVQFAIAVMRLADDRDDGPRGGRAVRLELIPVRAEAPARKGVAQRRR